MKHPPRTLAILNRKGGAGKTTTAAALVGAFAFAERGPVRLLDADPQGSAARWLGSWEPLTVEHVPDARSLGAALRRDWRGLTIVDGPPYDPAPVGVALGAADLVVVPAAASLLDLEAARPIVAAALEADRPVVVVLTLTDARASITADARDLAETFGATVAETELRRRVAHAEAAIAREPVTTYAPSSPAAAEARTLAAELAAILWR